jgi:hypothetical protein
MDAIESSLIGPCGMTPLEQAIGLMIGTEDHPPIKRSDAQTDTWAAFDAVLRPALEHGPCFVAYSGGRDSAMVLTAATIIARRHRLPDPVPITVQHEGMAKPDDEAAWQERIVRHLGLDDWLRIDVGAEIQLVGTWAQTVLRRHGVMFPASAYLLAPMLERARGGMLLVPHGGEDFFGFWRWSRVTDVLALRARPRRSDLKPLAMAAAPAFVRRMVAARKFPPISLPWLRPEAAHEVTRIFTRQMANVPVRFDVALKANVAHRCNHGAHRARVAVGEGYGASVLAPFTHPIFLASLAKHAGALGWGGRNVSSRTIMGDTLPLDFWAPRRPVDVNNVYFGELTQAFAAEWSGKGLDETIVDPGILRQLWLGDTHDWRTALLLQAAWLHDAGGLDRGERLEQDQMTTTATKF